MIENKLKRLLRREEVTAGNPATFNVEDYRIAFSINDISDFEILEYLWENYGLAQFKNGRLRLIDPKLFTEVIQLFNGVSKDAIPFARTSLGCFFIWDILDGEWVIAFLDIHIGQYKFSGDLMEDMFNLDVLSEPYWDDEWNGEFERKAMRKFPNLNENECVSFLPAIPAGGQWDSETMIKVEMFEHLFILSEMHEKL